MNNYFWKSVIIYSVLITALAGSSYLILTDLKSKVQVNRPVEKKVFKQPELVPGEQPWSVRSIDTQVISKHWPEVTREAIRDQVALLKGLGVNYIAIGTPYDRQEELSIWAEEIHDAGLHVWYRSHWVEWEGDEGHAAVMTPSEYLKKTENFILNNPDLFVEGDAFTVAVEPEQVGVGLGQRFLTWDDYRTFVIDQVAVSSRAFEKIGLEGRVHTNWISVNGWVVENQFNQQLVDQLGLIVVDHFVGQSQTIGELEDIDYLVNQTVTDLDKYHEMWGVPILLGEWGYQIFQETSDERQAEVIERVYTELSKRDYLVGVNYWVHMGNPPAIIDDEYGANLRLRLGAEVIKNFYLPE